MLLLNTKKKKIKKNLTAPILLLLGKAVQWLGLFLMYFKRPYTYI